MEYYTIAGMVLIAIIALFGLYGSIKKSVKDELGPVDELNINVVKLNSNFEHMLERDSVRDRRIEKHGQEMDELKENMQTVDKTLIHHEHRISQLEKTIGKE